MKRNKGLKVFVGLVVTLFTSTYVYYITTSIIGLILTTVGIIGLLLANIFWSWFIKTHEGAKYNSLDKKINKVTLIDILAFSVIPLTFVRIYIGRQNDLPFEVALLLCASLYYSASSFLLFSNSLEKKKIIISQVLNFPVYSWMLYYVLVSYQFN